jgi:integrase
MQASEMATHDPATAALVLVPAIDKRVAAAFAQILSDLGSPESQRAYDEEWKRFVAYLATKGIPPLAAQTFDVQTYLLGLRSSGKRQSTRARALAVIRAVYAALAREGVLDGANPAREARNPKGDSAALKTPWLSANELEQFLERRDYLVSMTLAMTGLRRAEVSRVAIDAIEHQAGTDIWNLRVRVKGGKYGSIELVAPLVKLLLAWAKEFNIQSGPLFRGSPKSPRGIGVGTVRNAVKRQAARAKFVDHEKFTPHAFRRSLATIAKQRGVPVEVVQHNLLHSKRDTTERYMKLSDSPNAPAKTFLDLLPKKFRKK